MYLPLSFVLIVFRRCQAAEASDYLDKTKKCASYLQNYINIVLRIVTNVYCYKKKNALLNFNNNQRNLSLNI